MKPVLKIFVVPVSSVLLLAAGPVWKTKQMEQWSDQDAKAILSGSPWVKKATPVLLPLQNETQRRAGGHMGGGDGIGVEAFNPAMLTGVGTSTAGKRRPIHMPTLQIRWESAAPVRTAEVKAHEEDPPSLEIGSYAVAVYDVPGIDITQKTLPFELKKDAFLKVDGKKKDRRASRVDVLPQEGGLTTIIYTFPRGEEITTADKRITFTALIGRLSLAQYFYTEEMQVQGKLEL